MGHIWSEYIGHPPGSPGGSQELACVHRIGVGHIWSEYIGHPPGSPGASQLLPGTDGMLLVGVGNELYTTISLWRWGDVYSGADNTSPNCEKAGDIGSTAGKCNLDHKWKANRTNSIQSGGRGPFLIARDGLLPKTVEIHTSL